MRLKTLCLAALILAVVCVTPASALEYTMDAPDDYLFARPTSSSQTAYLSLHPMDEAQSFRCASSPHKVLRLCGSPSIQSRLIGHPLPPCPLPGQGGRRFPFRPPLRPAPSVPGLMRAVPPRPGPAAFAATPFPGFQAAGFSSSRPQSRLQFGSVKSYAQI